MCPAILCLIKRPELQEILEIFFEEFELQAEWLDNIDLLHTGMDLAEEIKIFNCLLIDQACGTKELLTTLKLARYLSQTKGMDIVVFTNPDQAVFPIYQAGATICLNTPLDPEELETAFDRLFGQPELQLSEPEIEFESESNLTSPED